MIVEIVGYAALVASLWAIANAMWVLFAALFLGKIPRISGGVCWGPDHGGPKYVCDEFTDAHYKAGVARLAPSRRS